MSDFTSRLQKISENLTSLSQQSSVSMTDLFTPEFMASHSSVPSIEAFFEQAGLDGSPEGFPQIAEADIDAAVQRLTSYGSWGEMKARAGEIWAAKRLMAE